MFPNESSSYAISSKANAFVQNFKEEAVLDATAGRTLSSTIPTDQVPDSRDTAVDGGPVVNENNMPPEAAVIMSPQHVPRGATTTTHTTRIKSPHTGCEPCGCSEYPSKSEAECGRHTVGKGQGGREGCRAGPLSTSSNPNSISLSLSVISSSTCSARQPPPSLHCSALQDPNAMFASEYCGSSNSNSLSAQKKHHNTIKIPHITSQANHSQPESDKIGALYFQDNNISIKDNKCNNNFKENNNYYNNDTCSSNNVVDNNKTRVRECCTSQNIPAGKIITPCITTDTNVRLEKSFKIDCDDYGTRWGIPRGLRLAGGGESSLNTSGTGWGSSGGNNNNTNAGSGSSWGPGGSQNNNTGAQPPAGNPPAAQWPGNSRGQANTTSQGQPPSSQQNTGTSGIKSAAVSVAVSGNQQQNTSSTSTSSNNNQNQQQQPNQPNQQGQQTSGGNTNNQGQQNGSTSWAAAAGKGLPPSGNSGTPASSTSTTTTTNTNNSSTNNNSTTAKQQLEQLNTMREALFSLDGWGGQHVNQDSSWDIPPSPEPSAKDSNGGTALPVWKPNINNGTELWEANLRNGGQPPPAVAQKTPWGHTPTSNIGGTWGEDDDVTDTSNVWTGVPPSGAAPPPAQWGGANNPPGPATPMWASKKETDWGGGSNWGDPRGAAGGGMDPRDMGRSAAGGMVDPREHMRTVIDQSRVMGGGDAMMRDPRGGISGRLNTTTDPMWGGPPQQPPHHVPHHQAQPPNKMGPAPNAPVNQWPGPPPKDIGGGMPGVGVNVGGKPTGWEEPSPPAQRRNLPNYDDGTSLWGAQQQRNPMSGQAKVSHWKDMPTPGGIGRGMSQCPPGIPQNTRMPNASMPGNMKSDGPLWGHPAARNGAWEGGPHDVGTGAPWGEDKVTSGVMTPWSEPPLTPTPWGGPKPKPINSSGWVDSGDVDPNSWGHPPKQAPKPLSKELVWASKQFRILSDMHFKKEDVENALRIYNMSLEDALDYLNAMRGMASVGVSSDWRGRHADMDPSFDHPVNNPPSFPGRFNPPQMPFAPPGGGPTSAPNLLNNPGNPNLSSISPAIVQKILQQPPPQQAPSQQPTPFNQTSRTPQNQPSAQQLRMLVQQIQMAVSAGYLNHQILNQPLAPQTLLLLNQLLQQIKCLQQLNMQHQSVLQQAPMGKSTNSSAVLGISVQITKIKQQITNLQNQISAQQAVYVKQQAQQQQQQQQQQVQQQQQHHMPPQSQADFFKTNMHDPLSALQSNFSDLAMNKDNQVVINHTQQQQSRLNQWKLPSLEKDGDLGGNEFSRAPGTTTKSQGNSSPNPLNPLLSQTDGTWSSVTRSSGDTGWPDSNSVDVGNSDKDWPVVSSAASQAFTDLVPEFEPGKPWKGNQMKSIEDDPSITPGSVVRSPLSLPNIKDTEIFSSGNSTGSGNGTSGNGNGGGKTSPTTSGSMDMPIPSLSLSSNTWSFQPPASSAPSFNSPLSKLGGGVGSTGKNTWGEGPPPSELWSNPKPRQGPPPGLSKAPPTPGTSTASNGWGSLSGRWGSQHNPSWGSPWLLLKNLTPQIDGSTLKTLCLQHGPLQNFHMYLSHNIALAKYSTREEASKAQGALNNCVLGNTTIFADTPPESEVQLMLHSLGQQSTAGGANWSLRGSSGGQSAQQSVKNAPPPQSSTDTWGSGSQLWPGNPGGSTLWGTSPLDAPDPHRATPSLNSFLPGDLLGGESM